MLRHLKKTIELKKINVRKGEILQRSGDFNSKVYQVVSGLLRSFTIDEKGKEHIFMFAPENWTIADSVSPEKPCELFIEALEDSTIKIREKKVENAKNTQSLINRISVLQKRVIMLMSSSAIERYEHFIETYSDIAQRVPQRMIASYLGVTPETLSTVKKDWYKKHNV